ncbi:MAG: Tetratricopeptide 1 repeat-containing protein [Bacteroidetes bacterium]|nr:Tetratricopeptide 1 repeat-containing protein [Bacteroidota bacterium]
MKRSILTVLFAVILLTSSVHAQDAFATQMKVYSSALKYYDIQVATSALYNAMALKPERKDLRDSLANLYFMGERYGQAFTLGEEILKEDPKRMDMLAIVAVSKQSLGFAKEALADYETLYKDSKQVYYLYQIASLQHQLKRMGECLASLDQILADEAATKQQVNLRNGNNTSQNVPMKAACLNLKGIITLELNQPANAREFFNQAIKIFPDFEAAKANLGIMDQQDAQTAAAAKGGGQTAPKTTPPAKAPGK